LRIYVFYFTVIAVLWCMHATIGLWLYRSFGKIDCRTAVAHLPTALTVLCLAGMIYSRKYYQGFGQIIYYISYSWLGLVFLAFCFCIVCAIVRLGLRLLHLPYRWTGIFSIIGFAVIFAMAFWGGFSSPKVKRIPVQIDGMPKMKIALLSDSHLGAGVSLARFDRALTRLEAEKPDVLFVLGDIFEFGANRSSYAERIKQVNTPFGIYGVLGNHEYYVGYEKSKDFYREAGITLLEDTSAVLQNGVQVAGVRDVKTARVLQIEVEELIGGLKQENPIVFLSHMPLYAEEAAGAGADLMFSGHTHNGQLFPFNYLVRSQFPRVYGLFDVNGMKLYITSGLFYWGMPLRFLASSEIPIIEVN